MLFLGTKLPIRMAGTSLDIFLSQNVGNNYKKVDIKMKAGCKTLLNPKGDPILMGKGCWL